MKPVIFHTEAIREFEASVDYYERIRKGLGIAFQFKVERLTHLIQLHSEIGAPYKNTQFRFSLVKRFPYVIYYVELTDAIWIMAIAHVRRRPGYWKRRRIE